MMITLINDRYTSSMSLFWTEYRQEHELNSKCKMFHTVLYSSDLARTQAPNLLVRVSSFQTVFISRGGGAENSLLPSFHT
jgi:hypothetical protein